MSIPLATEIEDAVKTLFERARDHAPNRLLSALVPVRRILDGTTPSKITFDIPSAEMQEICEFVNQFHRPMNVLPLNENVIPLQTRLRVLIYCHVMEADLPYLIFRNLLAVILDQPLCWIFYARDHTGAIRVNEEGDKIIYRYPARKIAEIRRMSRAAETAVGDVLRRLWYGDLRNAFSHSQYIFVGRDDLILSGHVAPTPNGIVRTGNVRVSFTAEEIKSLHEGAEALLRTFNEAYWGYIKPYQNGEPQEIESGLIRWHEKAWYGV